MVKAYKVFRSDFTSVWNQPTIISPDHMKDAVRIKWELNKKNTHTKLYASHTLEEAVSWLISANLDYVLPKLMICEVDCEGLMSNPLDTQLKCNTITPIKIIPVSEYIHLILKEHSFYTRIIDSIKEAM